MTPGDIIFLGLLVGLFAGGFAALVTDTTGGWDSSPWRSFLIVFGMIFGLAVVAAAHRHSYVQTPEYRAKIEREQKEEFEAQTPRKIGEKDGCSVYAFKSGDRWHYFTKCQNTSRVDTTNTWTERRGKVTVEKSENITTEQN